MKIWLKTQHSKNEYHGIQFHHFIAVRWGNNGNSEKFYFLGLQNHCRWWFSHKIKTHLHLGRKAMTNINGILKSIDIALSTKVHLVKAMVFPVVIYGWENWTIKKSERQRIDTFELLFWRRFLRVPWTARRSNQSILKEISPEYSSEGLMLKLKLQYFGRLIWRTDSLEKTLMLGKIESRRRRGRQKIWCLDGITDSMDISCTISRCWWWTEKPGVLQSMGSQRVGHDWETELNWNWKFTSNMFI